VRQCLESKTLAGHEPKIRDEESNNAHKVACHRHCGVPEREVQCAMGMKRYEAEASYKAQRTTPGKCRRYDRATTST